MNRFRKIMCLLLAVTFGQAWASRGVLADDEVSPLSLVGESVAICLEVPDFEQTWTRFNKSDLATRLKSFPPVERFLSGSGFQKWMFVEEHVRRTTGKTLTDQLLGAFSEAIVVAVYLPDGKKPQGLLIGRARDENSLKQALQSWSTLDPNHVAQVREHHGQSYTRRAKSATSSEVVYYTTFGRTIILSDQESLIQEAVDNHAVASRKDASSDATSSPIRVLNESSLYRSNRVRLPGDSAAYVFLNARAWDKVLENASRHSPDNATAAIRDVFQRVSAIAVSLRLDNEAVVNVVADLSTDSRSAVWEQFVGATRGVGEWAPRIPARAIAALSSRTDFRPLIQAWLAIVPESKSPEFARGRKAVNSAFLGRDVFLDVLPELLRDWTVSVSLANETSSPDVPVEVLGRFSVTGSFGRNLDNALHFGMNLASAFLSFHNAEASNSVIASEELTKAGLVRSLIGLPGWSPSYLMEADLLTVATNRAALSPMSSASKSENPRLVAAERRYFASTSQLLWLDSVRLRELLARHGDWFSGLIAPSSAATRERVQMHLSGVREVLKLFDAAFVAAGFEEDHVRVVFGAALDRVE